MHRSSDSNLPEASLVDLYEQAPCGYISTRPDGTIVRTNQTFLTWTGYGRDELLARTRFQDLLTLPGKVFYETYYAPLLAMQGVVNEIALDLVCQDGQHLPILLNAVQRQETTHTPLLTHIMIFNASERRQYEEELQRARNAAEEALRLRDQFLALAAHELRTPLTSILGNVELLQRRLTKEPTWNERHQRTLQVINDQVLRLNRMVLSLFDLTRLESGQLSIERASVDVCALLSRIVDETRTAHPDGVFDLRCPKQAVVVQGDALRLEQVFQNLLQNGIRYSPGRASLHVLVTQHASDVCITVRDQGIGIPQAAIPHIFEQFYRAANSEARHIGGIGIGLYIVKEIVGLHGGRVTVESVEGRGSAFTVYVPYAPT